jgi:hypothetical protein
LRIVPPTTVVAVGHVKVDRQGAASVIHLQRVDAHCVLAPQMVVDHRIGQRDQQAVVEKLKRSGSGSGSAAGAVGAGRDDDDTRHSMPGESSSAANRAFTAYSAVKASCSVKLATVFIRVVNTERVTRWSKS